MDNNLEMKSPIFEEDRTIPDNTFLEKEQEITLMPLKNVVVFPGMVFPLKLSSPSDISLVKTSFNKKTFLGLIAPKEDFSSFNLDSIYNIGVIINVVKLVTLSKKEVLAVVEGVSRFRINRTTKTKPLISAKVHTLSTTSLDMKKKKSIALVQSIKEVSLEIINHMPNISEEIPAMIHNTKKASALIYYIITNFANFNQKQTLLEMESGTKRATSLLKLLLEEVNMITLQKKIHQKVHSDISAQQRTVYLKKQIKVLRQELGEEDENNKFLDNEIEQLKQKAKKMNWSSNISTYYKNTLRKLTKLNPDSSEYSLLYQYAQDFISLPWSTNTQKNISIRRAKQILEKEHYGMLPTKDRILSIIAVEKLKGGKQGKILCLHGPPGTGKTSLAKSIAKALGRKYIQIALGGTHDIATLRGHRRTYVGAMMGRIMEEIKKSGVNNPLILLDEIDKLDQKRGNLDAVLLEILDPIQNKNFEDHYIGAPFDLSNILFITTANHVERIPSALADRLEKIAIEGYAIEEKKIIAQKHLIPKAIEENGLNDLKIRITPKTIEKIITQYTYESGVRELYRKLDLIFGKMAKKVVFGDKFSKSLGNNDLENLLGKPPINLISYQKPNKPGISVGLAWSTNGGSILFIESSLCPGQGKVITSGQLGNVMQESAIIAHSYLKANSKKLGIKLSDIKTNDLHIHIPDGATPKDGPSAGIALCSAILSAYTKRKIQPHLALTGEMTLRGSVEPVGGIREKVLAARRSGIVDIILSRKNKCDVEDINPEFIKGLNFYYTDNVCDALERSLER